VRVSNDEIADLLERTASLLRAQQADSYRIRAYERASRTCRTLEVELCELERKGLEALPDIGKSIASSILEYVHTGRLGMLDRLEGQVAPEDLFTTLPGIGDELAHRIHDRLQVETLEELEVAAHDGRLEDVEGIGPRRAEQIREELESILSRSTRRRARRIRQREREDHEAPSVPALLAVDGEYRAKAAEGKLHRITPRRFNPFSNAWLPVLHTVLQGWYFTALFSNTARAHRLGKTGDWVVLVYERDGHEGQCTVVTEHQGPRAGQRVVRGWEQQTPEPGA